MLLVLIVAISLSIASPLHAQQNSARYALVIGNWNYTELGYLKNPRNDAEDMAAALKDLGFDVTTLLDASLVTMEESIERLEEKLSSSSEAIGLFYYAGHGVQSEGINYLIPSDARIPSDTYLKTKALSLQSVLDNLRKAHNKLNIVIIDACRDNPYQWARSGTRGLSVVNSQPVGSIVVFATSAGDIALDGDGRNGVFTGELLKYLKTPGIDVMDVFRRTGAGVQKVTNGKQNPAIYSQFFDSAYLAGLLPQIPSSVKTSPPVMLKKYGNAIVKAETGGILYIDDVKIDSIRAGGMLKLSNLEAGRYTFEMRYQTGEKETKSVQIDPDQEFTIAFEWKPQQLVIRPSADQQGTAQPQGEEIVLTIPGSEMQTGIRVQIRMKLIQPGSFLMGSRVIEQDRDDNEGPVHEVEITKPFYMGIYEVTQAQYGAVMGSNPSNFKGLDLPVENVSWEQCQEFIKRINTMGIGKFRLPTEAEWEYACRAGSTTRFPWGDDPDNKLAGDYAWYSSNSGKSTHPVGQKRPNAWGLYDMLGNVYEWCEDLDYTYPSGKQVDPINNKTYYSYHCLRGGSWRSEAKYLRSANRGLNDNSYLYSFFDPVSGALSLRYGFIGFRLVRELQ